MIRKFGIAAVAVSALALTASLALGAITFHSGPTFTQNEDGSITATADMSGLGNQPATATLVQNVTATYTCYNRGGNVAPGQKPVSFSSEPATQDLNTDHNGRDTLNLTADPVEPASEVNGKTAGCPNGNWTARDPVVTAHTATLTITQGGKVIYEQTITLD